MSSCTWTFCAKKMTYPPDVHVSGYTESRKEEIWQTVKIKASGSLAFSTDCPRARGFPRKLWPGSTASQRNPSSGTSTISEATFPAQPKGRRTSAMIGRRRGTVLWKKAASSPGRKSWPWRKILLESRAFAKEELYTI